MRFPTSRLKNPPTFAPRGECNAPVATTADNEEMFTMCGWISYLQTNHIDLWQIYLDEVERVKQSSPAGECFINWLKLDQEWAARVNAMLKAKVTA